MLETSKYNKQGDSLTIPTNPPVPVRIASNVPTFGGATGKEIYRYFVNFEEFVAVRLDGDWGEENPYRFSPEDLIVI